MTAFAAAVAAAVATVYRRRWRRAGAAVCGKPNAREPRARRGWRDTRAGGPGQGAPVLCCPQRQGPQPRFPTLTATLRGREAMVRVGCAPACQLRRRAAIGWVGGGRLGAGRVPKAQRAAREKMGRLGRHGRGNSPMAGRGRRVAWVGSWGEGTCGVGARSGAAHQHARGRVPRLDLYTAFAVSLMLTRWRGSTLAVARAHSRSTQAHGPNGHAPHRS